jgi:voltage-gated potassium channel
MADIQPPELTRAETAATLGLSALCLTGLLVGYYTIPIVPDPHSSVWWRLAIGIGIVAVVLSHEINAILRHHQPMRRAIIALAVILPLFVVMFSWLYITLSRSDPASFNTLMNRTKSLYFTITVLSTVGFGDIVPRTDAARIVVAVQMVLDLALFAVVVRLIFGAASRAVSRQRAESDQA